MKISGRSVIFAIAGAVLAVGGVAAPATADIHHPSASGATITVHHRGDGTQPPAELGNPSEWGEVTFKMDASAGTVTPLSESCVTPSSGGTWCYGWYAKQSGATPLKYCYSNYLQSTKGHASTVSWRAARAAFTPQLAMSPRRTSLRVSPTPALPTTASTRL